MQFVRNSVRSDDNADTDVDVDVDDERLTATESAAEQTNRRADISATSDKRRRRRRQQIAMKLNCTQNDMAKSICGLEGEMGGK